MLYKLVNKEDLINKIKNNQSILHEIVVDLDKDKNFFAYWVIVVTISIKFNPQNITSNKNFFFHNFLLILKQRLTEGMFPCMVLQM